MRFSDQFVAAAIILVLVLSFVYSSADLEEENKSLKAHIRLLVETCEGR